MRAALVTAACVVATLAACSKESPRPSTAPATPTATHATNATHATGGAVKNNASIGMATMKPDGTIVLQLRAEGPSGTVGDAQFEYKPGSKDYAMVMSHIGGITAGESKSVPPWPE